jgi:transcriptional/translational regulatory protein YebC/TACO1
MAIIPLFKTEYYTEVCINAKQVLEQVKLAFPNETYQSIAKRTNIHPQTIQRWSSRNRADAMAIRKLIKSLENEMDIDDILLKNATPAQLKRVCQEIGWDKVINS